jgi:hypothetical protein
MKYCLILLFLVGCTQVYKPSDVYTVEYKLENDLFWKTIDNVKGDLIEKELENKRVFILTDETRVEIPEKGTRFTFSKERFLVIKKNMEKDARQPIQTN